jgi:chromosome segregation ATPase
MLGFIKALPIIILLAGAGYAAHTFMINEKDKRIDQLQTQVDQLNQHNVALQTAAATNEATIKSLEANAKQQAEAMVGLTERNNELNAERDSYLRIFKDHDFTKLARARPGMIELRANRATEEVFRSVEADSRELDTADTQVGEPND